MTFYVVGIGASAGGLEAVIELLGALPAGTGMACIVVQHLDPHHESLLPEILAKKAAVPVSVPLDAEIVQPDHVYIIPPDATLTVVEGRFHLTQRPHSSVTFPWMRCSARSPSNMPTTRSVSCCPAAIPMVRSASRPSSTMVGSSSRRDRSPRGSRTCLDTRSTRAASIGVEPDRNRARARASEPGNPQSKAQHRNLAWRRCPKLEAGEMRHF